MSFAKFGVQPAHNNEMHGTLQGYLSFVVAGWAATSMAVKRHQGAPVISIPLAVHRTVRMTTKSEELFKRLCRQEGWTFHRIRPERQMTPDYEIEVKGSRILVEVKELHENDDDRRAVRDLEETGFYFAAPKIWKRIASRLQTARKQIKEERRDSEAAIVVFYDNTRLGINPIRPFDMKRAMYGEHKVRHVRNSATWQLLWRGEILGGQRKMTETSNTSISALASIFLQGESVGLAVYHNRFAEVPLLPDSLTGSLVRHFKLTEQEIGNWPDWVEVTEMERPANQKLEPDG